MLLDKITIILMQLLTVIVLINIVHWSLLIRESLIIRLIWRKGCRRGVELGTWALERLIVIGVLLIFRAGKVVMEQRVHPEDIDRRIVLDVDVDGRLHLLLLLLNSLFSRLVNSLPRQITKTLV